MNCSRRQEGRTTMAPHQPWAVRTHWDRLCKNLYQTAWWPAVWQVWSTSVLHFFAQIKLEGKKTILETNLSGKCCLSPWTLCKGHNRTIGWRQWRGKALRSPSRLPAGAALFPDGNFCAAQLCDHVFPTTVTQLLPPPVLPPLCYWGLLIKPTLKLLR